MECPVCGGNESEYCEFCSPGNLNVEDEVINLPQGDKIIVSGNTLTIGSVVMDYGRPVTRNDIENVITIYAMGYAANGRNSAKAWELLM